jgi:HD-GYP domain-containing protein (c-di-GMP phosphodiesterase class II)
VADVYDALTSNRSYRRAFTPPEALGLMRAEIGRSFDPEILQRFLDIVERSSGEQRAIAELMQEPSLAERRPAKAR